MNKKDIEINKLCSQCEKTCKQVATTILLSCPNYVKKPEQIQIKFSFSGKK